MSIKKEASGRRSVEVEVEVPGTVEEVWQAIATGPGISSWFVPAEVDEREGGTVACHFGPGMDSVAKVTAWEPPHRFSAESQDMGPNAPAVATEWTVEARSGGTCVVRVVHSLFASTDDWDNQLTGLETGWPALFRILRLYLTHFKGQRSASFNLVGFTSGPEAAAWEKFANALNLSGAAVGTQWIAAAGLPPASGVVEALGEAMPSVLLRLDDPSPGAVFVQACGMGEQVMLYAGVYLYGEGSSAAKARDEAIWQAWISERFPPMSADYSQATP